MTCSIHYVVDNCQQKSLGIMPRPLPDLVSFFQIHPELHLIWPFQPFLPCEQPQHFDKLRRLTTNMAVFTCNPFPLEYSPKIKVLPSDPDRLPYVPVQILYLIAQALPQPSQVFNLARVNKETWNYLQPALYECEVTYEARLVAIFGIGRPIASTRRSRRAGSDIGSIGQSSDSNPNHDDNENHDHSEATHVPRCAHALVTTLCEICGQRIAMAEKHFSSGSVASTRTLDLSDTRGVTALHWACVQGTKALPVARKAIEAAKAHQPSYIDGRGLRMRRDGNPPRDGRSLFGEIPPPLFIAAAFGNAKLCEALVEAGVNVNLHQAKDIPSFLSGGPFFRIHESCADDHCHSNNNQNWQWGFGLPASLCETAGHFALEAGTMDALGFLLDCGLDPLSGEEPLIHRAARTCNLPAIKTILDRFPEMVSHRFDGLTLLHVLCEPSGCNKKDAYSLEELKSIAAYLVQNGALLEAEGSSAGSRLTPLQFAVQNSITINSDKLNAPEALIMLGAVWNRFLDFDGTTILNHCVCRAASWSISHYVPGITRRVRETLTPEKRIKHGLVFAKLVKAMVRSTDPSPGQGGDLPIQAFLRAFTKLAMDREIVEMMGWDAFAIEAVGRLLLSTGISPDQGDMEKWRLLIGSNAEGQRGTEWAASPWRELVSDLPDMVGGE